MTIKIGQKKIGHNQPVFIIAELSCNHNQDLSLAKETIHAIYESGADAVKLQTYTPDTLTIDSKKKYFRINDNTVWDGMTLYQLYQESYTPWEWHAELQSLAHNLGLEFFTSAFDYTAVDFLETLKVPAYKVASFEIHDLPLIRYIAKQQKPIIISTGIATQQDIQEAVKTCRETGNNQIALLKCTSAYPTPLSEVNLASMPTLGEKFNTLFGLSDHTLGTTIPIAATALGATIIEKHFILDKSLGGNDSTFSLDPVEFKHMVNEVRSVEKAIGNSSFHLTTTTTKTKRFGRSLFAVKTIKKGEKFTSTNIRSIRPGDGLHPKFIHQILGKKASLNISKGTALTWSLVS